MAKLPLSLTTKMLASCSGQEKHGNRPKLYRYANKEKNSNDPQKPLFIKKNFFTTSSVITVLIYGIE